MYNLHTNNQKRYFTNINIVSNEVVDGQYLYCLMNNCNGPITVKTENGDLKDANGIYTDTRKRGMYVLDLIRLIRDS